MLKTSEPFDIQEFANELPTAKDNLSVGTKVLFENDRVRVWELALQPGQRAPFHCHTIDYFWVAADPGQVVQRIIKDDTEGEISSVTHERGEVKFFTFRDGDILVHDLANVGDKPLRYITIELLDGDNTMPHSHLPESV